MVDIERLRALLAAATPGPWEVDDDHTPCIWGHEGSLIVSPVVETPADAALIVAAINALPDLLGELTRLRELEADAIEAIAAWHGEHAAEWACVGKVMVPRRLLKSIQRAKEAADADR